MNKKTKIIIIIVTSLGLFLYWLGLAITHTKLELINYWWEAFLAAFAILYGVFGMMSAKHWSWLKSGVGKGLFFISLGLIMWGIGQAGWTYAVIKDPSQQNPPSYILSTIYYLSIPLWFYGMIRLSTATGAKYGLRKLSARIGLAVLIIVMLALSYYLLVVVARGGTKYFYHNPIIDVFFDLGYAAGDVLNLTFALAIFGLSWNYLGGRFKKPVLLILSAFAVTYLADLLYSFYDGRGQYYNGHWVDLVYLLMVAVFGIGLCLLDPDPKKKSLPVPVSVPMQSSSPPSPPTQQSNTGVV